MAIEDASVQAHGEMVDGDQCKGTEPPKYQRMRNAGQRSLTDYFALQQDLEDNVTDPETKGAQSKIRIVFRGGYIAPESSKAHPESPYGDQEESNEHRPFWPREYH